MRRLTILVLLGAVIAVALTLSGCTVPVSSSVSEVSETTGSLTPTPTHAASSTNEPEEPPLAEPAEPPGKPHKGDVLFLEIAASEKTEKAAREKLARALPAFGDLQSYHFVAKSDRFEGLKPGFWVVAEAFWLERYAEEMGLGKRIDRKAYVKRVIVKTGEPVAVYEELVQGLGIQWVKVPGINGKFEADKIIAGAGLVPVRVDVHGPIEPDAAGIGEAYRQRPYAGRKVPKGTVVVYHAWWESQ